MVMLGKADRATRSYLIPVGDLSLQERREMRAAVDEVLVANALRTAIRDQPEDLVIRDTLPNTDFALNAQESWVVAGPGVLATELQFFSVAIAATQIIGFWGVAPETVPLQISRVRLTVGAASATSRASFQLEQLYSRLEPVGYFSEAVIFTKLEVCRVMVMPRGAFAANGQVFPLLARTAEPIGAVVSAPSA